MALQRAVREKMKVPILLMGASGAGKTVGALLIAKGIVWNMFPDLPDHDKWGKIAVIDTEHKRSTLYAGMEIKDQEIGSFLVYDLVEPYTSERYENAFNECKRAGAEVIIVDSITHAWNGSGGILEEVDKLGGRFSDWSKVRPKEKQFLELFLDNSVHVIATVRSKQGYEVTRNDSGKIDVEKVGLKIEQKDSLEYEFAMSFQLYHNHMAEAMKDNSNSFEGRFTITEDTGRKIYQWAEEGIDVRAIERQAKRDAIERIETLAQTSDAHQELLDGIRFKMKNIPLESFNQVALDRCVELLEGLDDGLPTV